MSARAFSRWFLAGAAQWRFAFDPVGCTDRGAFWAFMFQWLAVVAVWQVVLVAPPVVAVGPWLVGWTLWGGLGMVFLVSAAINAGVRRLRDAGVNLAVPASAFALVCFSVAFDGVHGLSVAWYGRDFWTNTGPAFWLNVAMFGATTALVAASAGGLALRSWGGARALA